MCLFLAQLCISTARRKTTVRLRTYCVPICVIGVVDSPRSHILTRPSFLNLASFKSTGPVLISRSLTMSSSAELAPSACTFCAMHPHQGRDTVELTHQYVHPTLRGHAPTNLSRPTALKTDPTLNTDNVLVASTSLLRFPRTIPDHAPPGIPPPASVHATTAETPTPFDHASSSSRAMPASLETVTTAFPAAGHLAPFSPGALASPPAGRGFSFLLQLGIRVLSLAVRLSLAVDNCMYQLLRRVWIRVV